MQNGNKTKFYTGAALLVLSCLVLLLSAGTVLLHNGQKVEDVYTASAAQQTLAPIPRIPVDNIVNSGTVQELTAIDGISEKTAQAIVDAREASGPFVYAEDLLSVKGIGEKTLQKIRPLLGLE